METMNRMGNSMRNIFYGLLKYSIMIIAPFIMRTVLIYKLGIEYAGITSLFSSILQVLSLSELGFSSAVVYSLYVPVAKNDIPKICALLKLFKKIYSICGTVILIFGLAVCPFIKHLINGTYPSDINIYNIFIIMLINTAVSYLFSGYKSVLFIAYQRDDILSKCQILANLVMCFLQFFFLFVTANYYLYVISLLIGTLLNNYLMYRYSKKMLPQIVCAGSVEQVEKKKLYSNVKALFGHQLDMVVITSTDNIVISAFMGLTTLTIYNNYYYVISAVLNMLIMIANSFVASIANSIVVEKDEKNYRDFISFTYSLGLINVGASVLMLVLFQDFMRIWMGKEMLFQLPTVILLVLSFYVRQFRRSVLTYKNAAGVWMLDRYKPYVASLVNLGMSILLVTFIGLNGVIISTIVSMVLIEIPWETKALFSGYFKRKASEYIYVQSFLIVKLLGASFFSYFVLSMIKANSLILLLGKGILSLILVSLILIVFSVKDSEYKRLVILLKRMLIPKFQKIVGWGWK
jgi:O-antigen/teichoic acid export membrane protein